jgi:GalNAc5-diNAcBac-PP-undecaprenol beta-1,3-glucosyltransferase
LSPPAFSVVVPTYNRAHLIGDTLASVLAQSDPDLELLVVDDGSIDGTGEVVGQLTDPRVRYLPVANGERGAARNHGLRHARGAYVVFLDSDDLLHRDHLATLREAIAGQAHPPNFVATKYDYSVGGVRRLGPASRRRPGWYGLDDFARGNFLACNVCVRRDNPHLCLFEEDRRYAAVEDWLFLLQNMEADKLLLVDRHTVTMVEHSARSLRADNSALVDRLRLAVHWIEDRLALNARQLRWARGRAYWLCAVHAYADSRRAEAWLFARRAFSGLPPTESLMLTLRLLVGAGPVARLKAAIWSGRWAAAPVAGKLHAEGQMKGRATVR